MGLKKKIVSGTLWTSVGTIGSGFVSFLVTMILARLLTPYDFALIELLIIFTYISNVIVDSGFSQAIIRDDNPTETDLSSVFYFNISLSCLIYVLLFFVSPYIANYFDAPELANLSRVVFLVIIFNSFTIIQNATLSRELNFKAISQASVAGMIIAGVIAVGMAFSGFGVWALVANMVLQPLFKTIFLWTFSKWKPTREFSFKSIKRYFNFGGFLMLQGIIDAVVSNIVSLFIGKVYTKNDLGYFSQGRRFDGYIVSPGSAILEKVTYPILSKIKNEKNRLREGYKQIIGVTMVLYIPLMLFVSAASENMIVVFFGEKWSESGIYLRLFAIGGLFYPLQKICVNIVYVKGKTKIMLRYALLKQGIRLVAIIAVLKVSVIALAYAFVISGIIGSLLYIYLGMKYISYSFKEIIIDLYQIIIATFISISLVTIIGNLLSDWNVVFVFLIQLLTMITAQAILMRMFKNIYYIEVISLIKSIIPKKF